MKVYWVEGKAMTVLTIAPGIYATVYRDFMPTDLWCFRSIGGKVEKGFRTKADAKEAAEEYVISVVNSAMNNIYN